MFQCFLWTAFCSPAVKVSGSCMGARRTICSYCCITICHSKVTIIQNKIRILFSKLFLILKEKKIKIFIQCTAPFSAQNVTEEFTYMSIQKTYCFTLRNVKNNLEPSVCKSAYCSLYNYCYWGEMRGSWSQELGYGTGNPGFSSTGSTPEVQEMSATYWVLHDSLEGSTGDQAQLSHSRYRIASVVN